MCINRAQPLNAIATQQKQMQQNTKLELHTCIYYQQLGNNANANRGIHFISRKVMH